MTNSAGLNESGGGGGRKNGEQKGSETELNHRKLALTKLTPVKDMQSKASSATSNGTNTAGGQVNAHRQVNSSASNSANSTASSNKNCNPSTNSNSNSNSGGNNNSSNNASAGNSSGQQNGMASSVQVTNSTANNSNSNKIMSKSSTYNGKSSRQTNANSSNNQVTGVGPQQQQQSQPQPQVNANCAGTAQQTPTAGIGQQPANAFLSTATMISPYLNMNMNAAARLHQAATAAAVMPYSINRLYPPIAAAAAASAGNPYANSTLTGTGYHTHPGPQLMQTANHTNQHHVSHSIYQTSRMPASSPPVSSSNNSGSSSQGSSTSGIGSSASSTGGNIGGNANSNTNLNSNVNVNIQGSGTPIISSSQQGQATSNGSEQLSKTNLYIRGLQPTTSDKDLYALCAPYGAIISTKAILDKNTNKCKGYGFVDFESPLAAEAAVKSLQNNGYQAQMAKCTDTCRSKQSSSSLVKASSNAIANSATQMNNSNVTVTSTYSSVYTSSRPSQQQEQDPTNLYIANLPPYMTETELEAMLNPYGTVISTRILRDSNSQPRGVGFARMESKEKCDTIINTFNNKLLPSCKEPLLVKFADGGNKKKTQYRNTDNRWRENSSGDHITAYTYQTTGDHHHHHHHHQANVTQNGVTSQLIPPTIMNAPTAAYSPHQRSYTTPPVTGSYPITLQANAHPWMHATPQYHLIPASQHMQPSQMIQSHTQIDPSTALHFGALMPQLTAQVSQLQLSGHSYITGNPNQYANPGTPGIYAQAGTPIMQSVQLPEAGDGQNHPSSGNSSVGPQEEMLQGQHAYQMYGPK